MQKTMIIHDMPIPHSPTPHQAGGQGAGAQGRVKTQNSKLSHPLPTPHSQSENFRKRVKVMAHELVIVAESIGRSRSSTDKINTLFQ